MTAGAALAALVAIVTALEPIGDNGVLRPAPGNQLTISHPMRTFEHVFIVDPSPCIQCLSFSVLDVLDFVVANIITYYPRDSASALGANGPPNIVSPSGRT